MPIAAVARPSFGGGRGALASVRHEACGCADTHRVRGADAASKEDGEAAPGGGAPASKKPPTAKVVPPKKPPQAAAAMAGAGTKSKGGKVERKSLVAGMVAGYGLCAVCEGVT